MTIKNSLQSGFFLFIFFFNLQLTIAQKSNKSDLEAKKKSNTKRNKSY
jgi:hypothetical protein